MSLYKGYKDLHCYVHGRALRIEVAKLVSQFPKTEIYGLTSQIRNASRSVTANIAEGYGRFRYPDKRHFFIVARGSVTETAEHLSTAFDENYITAEQLAAAEKLCETVEIYINAYIAYLDRQNNKRK